MKRSLLYVVLGVTCVGAIIAYVAWRTWGVDQPEQDVRSAVVERGTLLVTVAASGNVEPLAEADLVFDVSGQVAEVLVEVGDRVEAGDVLAQLDTAVLVLQMQQAEAALASAEAKRAQLLAGPRPEEIAAAEANVRAAEAQVNANAATRDQIQSGPTSGRLAAAEADYASALAQQLAAETIHDKTLTCVKFTLPGGEKKEFCPALGKFEEQTRYNLEAADVALFAAQVSLDDLRGGADVYEVRAAEADVAASAAQLDTAQAQLALLLAGAVEAEIDAAGAQVSQAQATVDQAELGLEGTTLRAPISGIVAAVEVAVGEMATAGRPVITLIDTSGFQITVAVDELDVGILGEGEPAQVVVDALPGTEIAGVVERIAPAAMLEGGVVTYDVVIGLAPVDVAVRTDMTANVTIVVEEVADVLTIPTWVVRVDRSSGQTYVDRQVGDGVERVDVTLGVRHEGAAQVLDGLSEGDVVIWVTDDSTFGL
jgi:HlyD family secretion protein